MPTDDAIAIIDAVRRLVDEHWRPDVTLRSWWQGLADAGLAFPGWPVGLGGRGAGREGVVAAYRALAAAGVLGPPPGLGTTMGGPVVIEHGTDEQRGRLVPPLAAGTEGWCQLFSEPGAGSDLAGLATRAERDGDEWVITGQKVWTSGALECRRGMLVARSDWDQPKHRGLTYFIIDMQQPGIEVRPLRQMNGQAHFNEVFLTEARVADTDRIGAVNGGWAVATATLAYERRGLSATEVAGLLRPAAGDLAGDLDRPVGELVAEARRAAEADGGAGADEAAPGSYASLLALADGLGRRSDPTIRPGLADAYARETIARVSQARAAGAARAGRAPGAESSTAKLFWTNGLRRSSAQAMTTLGAHGTISDDRVTTFFLSVPSASIAGGSDEIQRNIVGERSLGLPKDISVDTDVPFREVKRS